MATQVSSRAASQATDDRQLLAPIRTENRFRSTCKICYASNRRAKQTHEEKALKNHARIVAAAKKKLENPSQLSVGELHKLENLVRLADKHQAKLAAKVDEQRQAEEAAKFAQSANPSLARVRRWAQFGSGSIARPRQNARLFLKNYRQHWPPYWTGRWSCP